MCAQLLVLCFCISGHDAIVLLSHERPHQELESSLQHAEARAHAKGEEAAGAASQLGAALQVRWGGEVFFIMLV